ncbi:sensor histidine kinase [Pedobacter metabolipauper]|nr:HAMP domain-containing sensor histidine kinase [Pedobacter metabolipauper]
MFHKISLIGIFFALILAIHNFSTTLLFAAVISILFAIVQFVLFYISRFKNQTSKAIIFTAIQVNLIFAAGYFYNAGISGSVSLLFLMSLSLLILVSPAKSWKYYLTTNILMVIGLMLGEYYNPDVIKQQYSTRWEMFGDQMFTYMIAGILMYICTSQLRRNYDLQRKFSEEKAVRLELLNKEKDKLFSIIAHDLNAPLSSLKQYLDLLNVIDFSVEERKDMEVKLGLSVDGIQELLKNLLFWARNELNELPVNLQPIVLGDHLIPTTQMFTLLASQKGITLITEIPECITIVADHNMIDLIVRNLLNNAIKFSTDKGVINLLVERSGTKCIITVKDFGVGIPVEQQKFLFTRNIKPSYGTSQEKGTGLGLALCKEFVTLQGGEISFSSKPGQETVFKVILPLFQ